MADNRNIWVAQYLRPDGWEIVGLFGASAGATGACEAAAAERFPGKNRWLWDGATAELCSEDGGSFSPIGFRVAGYPIIR